MASKPIHPWDLLKTMTMTSERNSIFTVEKNQDLGLYEGTLTVQLPTISVTRYKADRNDFRYEMRRAVEEIVGEIVEKLVDE